MAVGKTRDIDIERKQLPALESQVTKVETVIMASDLFLKLQNARRLLILNNTI